MSEDDRHENLSYLNLNDCLLSGVYWITTKDGNSLGVYDGNHRFIRVAQNVYGSHLVSELHKDSTLGKGTCEPWGFYGMLPTGIEVVTNLGLVCQYCNAPVSGSPWKHNNGTAAPHKPLAVWAPNTALIDFLLTHSPELQT
jgi:hypothetical protein